MKRIIYLILVCIVSLPCYSQGQITRKESTSKKTLTSSYDVSGSINGHEYVDLGLPSGTKWATCNLGATKPHNYGNYYAWGETSPKSTYTWDNYFDYESGSTNTYRFKKYEVGKLKQIDPDSGDDAARAVWGSSWRVPTIVEMDELRHNCKWDCTKISGISGWKVTGPNGKSIFLPFAGERKGNEINRKNEWGMYWTSSLLQDYPSSWGNAESIAGYWRGITGSIGDRCIGASIRPVSD